MEESVPNNIKDAGTGDLGDRHISVASDCQAIYRVVPPHETEAMSRNFGSTVFHVPGFPSLDAIAPSERLYEKRNELDADLVELLLCLDWKMNLFMKMLAPTRDETLYPHRASINAISVATIKIGTNHPLTIGNVLEFHFVLPILPFKELFLRGEVVRTGTGGQGAYDILLHAHLLKESDREHLIRYVVMRQFQIKREAYRSS